jgi:hypothetical protein
MHAAVASMIMYYTERTQASEMRQAQIELESAFERVYGSFNAQHTLDLWGIVIRTQFTLDNEHLTARKTDAHCANEALVATVMQLGKLVVSSMGSMQSTVLGLQQTIVQMAQQQALMVTEHSQMQAQLAQLSPKVHAPVLAPAAALVPALVPAPASAPVMSCNSLGGAPVNLGGAKSSMFDKMRPDANNTASPQETMSTRGAGEFFQSCMAKGGTLPPMDIKEKQGGNMCLNWFKSMATAEERTVLSPPTKANVVPDEGERRRIVTNLTLLVASRLGAAFTDNKLEVPSTLKKIVSRRGIGLFAGAIHGRVRDLKKHAICVTPDEYAFLKWREAFELPSTPNSSHKRPRVL